MPDLFSEIRTGARSSKNEVAMSAVLALSGIDEVQDALLAEAVAGKGPPAVSRIAIASLSRMCNPEAKLALFRIESQTQDKKQREFLRTTRHQYEGIRSRSGRCERHMNKAKSP